MVQFSKQAGKRIVDNVRAFERTHKGSGTAGYKRRTIPAATGFWARITDKAPWNENHYNLGRYSYQILEWDAVWLKWKDSDQDEVLWTDDKHFARHVHKSPWVPKESIVWMTASLTEDAVIFDFQGTALIKLTETNFAFGSYPDAPYSHGGKADFYTWEGDIYGGGVPLTKIDEQIRVWNFTRTTLTASTSKVYIATWIKDRWWITSGDCTT